MSVRSLRPRRQARCANRQLGFPVADLDAILLFLFATVGEHFRGEATAELYMRLVVSRGSEAFVKLSFPIALLVKVLDVYVTTVP